MFPFGSAPVPFRLNPTETTPYRTPPTARATPTWRSHSHTRRTLPPTCSASWTLRPPRNRRQSRPDPTRPTRQRPSISPWFPTRAASAQRPFTCPARQSPPLTGHQLLSRPPRVRPRPPRTLRLFDRVTIAGVRINVILEPICRRLGKHHIAITVCPPSNHHRPRRNRFRSGRKRRVGEESQPLLQVLSSASSVRPTRQVPSLHPELSCARSCTSSLTRVEITTSEATSGTRSHQTGSDRQHSKMS